jgi:hypothetical protein
METFGDNIGAKKGKYNKDEFYCNTCDFKCFKKYSWERHLMTLKHENSTKGDKMETKKGKKGQKYICDYCSMEYSSRNGLWKHNKKCLNKEDEIIIDGINIKDKDALVIHLLKQNGELHNKLIEISSDKSITNNTNCHNTTNNDNKTFNLNFFLNETCKNAMNINEFVSSIKLSLEDLEFTGRNGYIQGITNIIFKNLKSLEKNERPFHCNDLKREILYIKDSDQWIKETEEKPILTKAIKVIANENIKKIKDWKDLNPDCVDSDSKKNNLYLKIVSNSMNGSTQEESSKNINKIISNVVKEVIIEK